MIPNPIPTFILLTLGVLTFLFIMLLPSLIELKKPKDAGPKMIAEYTFGTRSKTQDILMMDMEEEQAFDQIFIKKMVDIISFLPNIEA